ncbi:hypothetical protein [Cellulomonas xiejunii]|uniref:DUF3618 domain-containing protein n=2 Tax=Cellulomonas xiejunii TaxID=2968083 RepID=A0ABY5KY07_9CELL|nr:hypothetical protein [Cellulomonas xiejunii]UUI73238.1 hypothetical protein NP048_07325 [Cellulomonas xiejunii]
MSDDERELRERLRVVVAKREGIDGEERASAERTYKFAEELQATADPASPKDMRMRLDWIKESLEAHDLVRSARREAHDDEARIREAISLLVMERLTGASARAARAAARATWAAVVVSALAIGATLYIGLTTTEPPGHIPPPAQSSAP